MRKRKKSCHLYLYVHIIALAWPGIFKLKSTSRLSLHYAKVAKGLKDHIIISTVCIVSNKNTHMYSHYCENKHSEKKHFWILFLNRFNCSSFCRNNDRLSPCRKWHIDRLIHKMCNKNKLIKAIIGRTLTQQSIKSYYFSNGSIYTAQTDTGSKTDTDTNKLAYNRNLCWCLSLCSVSTSTQFFANKF